MSTGTVERVDDVRGFAAKHAATLGHVKRFLACIGGSLVLALMYGEQEGSDEDYGLAFHEAILDPRVFTFLGIGVVAFLLLTFGQGLRQYVTRPGVVPFATGLVSVLAAYTLIKWYDPVGDGKLSAVADAVEQTSGLSFIATAFFDWLYWVGLLVVAVVGGIAIALERVNLAWIGAALALAMGVIALIAKQAVADFDGRIDHSLGGYITLLAYLVVVATLVVNAVTNSQTTFDRALLDRVLSRWAGAILAGVGIALGICAFTFATWFSPLRFNDSYSGTASRFADSGVQQLTLTYLQWLGWVLFAVTAVIALVSAVLRVRVGGWVALAAGVVGLVLTLVALYKASELAASLNVDGATGPWQNLGAGGWVACAAFSLLAAGGFMTASSRRDAKAEVIAAPTDAPVEPGEVLDADELAERGVATADTPGVPITAATITRRAGANPTTRALILFGLTVALFFPPTMTTFWQNVVVSQIGVYVLLAVGLNVVVGWAGLLDLGYIAFFAIGSYTTAYLVGSLPIKPPDWLEMPPLVAIPFAIVVCLVAGVALGAPTLRLRGDYLAIVTLGFGEIIRIAAINNPGKITNGTGGPRPAVPHPSIDIGPIEITWSLNNLQYWYLLLVIIVIVVLLFNRLEGSRLGRAWSAIREDEVAAQATGINTTKVKLLAFAIGASTSGLAGVFFASQVGYFNPDNFLLVNSILVVAYVVFGGMGSLPGAMAGAAVLTWLPEFLREQVPAEDRQMWIGLIVLLMMIFRPAGLLPARRRKAELDGLHDSEDGSARAVPASGGN